MFIRGPTGNKIMKKMNSKISYAIIPSKKEKIYEIQNHFLLFYVHTVTFHCKDSKEYYTKKVELWKCGITDTVPTRTGYYGYNDTTEVVVELTLIFL